MSETDSRRSVGVHVDNFEDMVFRTEETEPEHFSFSTITLVPGQNPLDNQVLALDPLRKAASLLPLDAPVVLCDSPAQAASPSNQVAGFPAPDGAYTPQGTSVSVTGTGPAWAACQAATRLVVIISRRSALWLTCNSATRAGRWHCRQPRRLAGSHW
jgi:hypothetical protein